MIREILCIAVGLIIGGVSIWFVQKFRVESKCVPKEDAKELEVQVNQLKLEDATKSERLSALGISSPDEPLLYNNYYDSTIFFI